METVTDVDVFEVRANVEVFGGRTFAVRLYHTEPRRLRRKPGSHNRRGLRTRERSQPVPRRSGGGQNTQLQAARKRIPRGTRDEVGRGGTAPARVPRALIPQFLRIDSNLWTTSSTSSVSTTRLRPSASRVTWLRPITNLSTCFGASVSSAACRSGAGGAARDHQASVSSFESGEAGREALELRRYAHALRDDGQSLRPADRRNSSRRLRLDVLRRAGSRRPSHDGLSHLHGRQLEANGLRSWRLRRPW